MDEVEGAATPAEAAPARPPGGFARLVRDSAAYALGSVAGKIIGLVLLPITTRLLVPAEYGRLDVLSTLATALTSVGVLGLDVAATRLYPEVPDGERRRMFGTWTVLTLVVSAMVAGALAIAAPSISDLLFDTTSYAWAVALVGLYVVGNLFQVVGLTALRNLRRPFAYASVSTAAFVANGVLVVVLLRWRPEVSSAMAGMALGVVVGGALAMVVARRLVFGRPSGHHLRSLLRLGLPLVPALAVIWLGDFVNRAVLLADAGASEVGFLSVAVRFGSVGLLVVMGFQLAWHPLAFGMGQAPDALRRIADDGRRIMVGVALTVVPLGLVSPELLRIVSGEAYEPALPALGLSLVAAVATGLYTVATMPSAISQKMRDLGVSATIGGIVTIAANLVAAPLAGSGGTAAAMVLGQLAAVAVAIILARGRAPVPLAWGRISTISALATVVVLLATLPPGGASILVRAALGVVFVVVLAAEGSLGELARFVRQAPAQLRGR